MSSNDNVLPKIWLDEQTQEIYQGDKPIHGLTHTEQMILRFLIQNSIVRHTQHALIEEVWSKEAYNEKTSNTLQVHIAHIRKRIEPEPSSQKAQYIVTWYGRPGGYQFFPEGKPQGTPADVTEIEEGQLDKIWLDEKTELIYQGDRLVQGLSVRQLSILRYLTQHPFIKYTQDDLIKVGWTEEERKVGDKVNALQVQIVQIRKQIEPDPMAEHARYLVTWYGSPGGYQFFPQGRPEEAPLAFDAEGNRILEKIWLDEKTKNLYRGQFLIQGLSTRQVKLLAYFVKHPFIKHPREILIDLVWTEKEDNKEKKLNALQVHIVHIRKRVEFDYSHPQYLLTWQGRETTGYQFLPEGKAELPSENWSEQSHIKEGLFWFDEATQQIYQGQTLIHGLTERQFFLLRYLVQNPYTKHSHYILIKEAWTETERSKGVTLNALHVHLSQIRRKIEPDHENPSYMLRWDGRPGGYYFLPDGQPQTDQMERERTGNIWFDEASQGIYQGETVVEGLSKGGYTLLQFLIAHPRVRHPQSALIEHLYPNQGIPQDKAIKALYHHVKQIRKQIEADRRNPRYLITGRSGLSGYQFYSDGDLPAPSLE